MGLRNYIKSRYHRWQLGKLTPSELEASKHVLFGTHTVRIIKVYDGDTFTFTMMYLGKPLTLNLRVLGINAPELHTGNDKEGGRLAREKLVSLLKFESIDVPCFARVWLQKWDKYGGRVDGDVFDSDGKLIGEQMIASGHAVRFMEDKVKRPDVLPDES